MTDPYRDQGAKCPTCHVGPMRGFGQRSLCDQCGGMMIAVADLEASINLPGELVVEDGAPGRPCPACMQIMAVATLRLGKDQYGGGVERCAKHGLWLDGGILEKALVVFGRRHYVSNRRSYVNQGGGFQMFGHVQAYVPGGGGGGTLAIQNWWMRTHPREHTPFHSAFADAKLACPCCDGSELHLQAERWPCARCDGAFVENAALEEMMGEMRGAPWDLPAVGGRAGLRHCPACKELMTVQQLEGVEVDRCASHGIWFDAGELAVALHHTAPAKGWLRWLLR